MKKLRILILDEDEDFTDSLSIILENFYVVESSSNSNKVIEDFSRKEFNIVFISYELSEKSGIKDGIDCYYRLRAINPNSKFIFLTKIINSEILSMEIEQRVLRILDKPIDLMLLLSILRREQ